MVGLHCYNLLAILWAELDSDNGHHYMFADNDVFAMAEVHVEREMEKNMAERPRKYIGLCN